MFDEFRLIKHTNQNNSDNEQMKIYVREIRKIKEMFVVSSKRNRGERQIVL